MIPIFTPRLALLSVVSGLAMFVLPDSWPGVADSLRLGPWDVPGPVLVTTAALVILALADALLAGHPDTIEIHRQMPSALAINVPDEITWQLRNPSRFRRVVSFADELAPSLRADTRRARVHLPPRGIGSVSTRFHPARRGDFAIDEVAVRVEGPLGLASRQSSRSLPNALRVLPAFRSRQEAELRLSRQRIQEVGLRAARGAGGSSDFDQLREYTPDDEFRRIDWSATARSQRTIVRTYRTEKNQRLVVLLDNGRTMASRVDGVTRVEHGMDAVLTLTAVSTGMGDKCGLITFDRSVNTVLAPSASRTQLSRAAQAMYALQPQLVESNYRHAFVTAVSRFRRRAMLVILTDLVPQSVDVSLLPALPLIARSHLVVVGAVRDPDIVSWASAAPVDADETYRKAAAIVFLAERDKAIVRLRQQGVVVVDAEPGRLGTELTDSYLEMKTRGQL